MYKLLFKTIEWRFPRGEFSREFVRRNLSGHAQLACFPRGRNSIRCNRIKFYLNLHQLHPLSI